MPPEHVREIAPGWWRIRLPFHLELDHVHAHLLRAGAGYALVDCGFKSAESLAALEAALAGLGVPWTSIHDLILTHTHPDHCGLAPEVLKRSGARLSMSASEASVLSRAAKSRELPSRLGDMLLRWGAPDDVAARVTSIFREMRLSWTQLIPDRELAHDGRVQTDLGEWTIVDTPGHSHGHVCFYLKERELLIAGDHVLPSISPNISWTADYPALQTYLESLDRISRLRVRLAVPSHGELMQGVAMRAADIARHHQQRCELIRSACAGEPATPHEIVGRLWANRLSEFQYRFAMFEVVAHLELLEASGEATQTESGAWRAA